MGFRRDLKLGNQAESLIQTIFAKHGVGTKPNEAKLAEYDIEAILPNKVITLEAKFDLYCARSGNIAIEFYNPKKAKDSGVNATKADLWAHVITSPMSVWITSVKALKEFIGTVPAHKTVTCGGDDNSSMYLYKKEIIFDAIFHRIDECDSVEFHRILSELLVGESLCSV